MFLASFDLHRTREATGLVQYVGHSWPSEKLNSGEGFRSSLGIPPLGGNHKRRATVSNRESKLREGSFAMVLDQCVLGGSILAGGLLVVA